MTAITRQKLGFQMSSFLPTLSYNLHLAIWTLLPSNKNVEVLCKCESALPSEAVACASPFQWHVIKCYVYNAGFSQSRRYYADLRTMTMELVTTDLGMYGVKWLRQTTFAGEDQTLTNVGNVWTWIAMITQLFQFHFIFEFIHNMSEQCVNRKL